ncbi:MAG: hypothetical protein WCY55_08145, partial [Anaerovoracaceae bacterium]
NAAGRSFGGIVCRDTDFTNPTQSGVKSDTMFAENRQLGDPKNHTLYKTYDRPVVFKYNSWIYI